MIENIPEKLTVFDDLVSSYDIDKELAYKFFITFSWFEHVLKAFGHVRNRGYVQINWIEFGERHNDNFNPERTPELKAAIEYLQAFPPGSQQFDKHNVIVWDEADVKGASLLAQILSKVTTVRNNFFHGGKFPEFRERDADLMRCCLIILDECTRLSDDLRYIYQHQIENH